VKVLAYLIGGGENQDTPKTVVRENVVEVKIGREKAVFEDSLDHASSKNRKPGDDGKYRS
jgi:hypothetical protein